MDTEADQEFNDAAPVPMGARRARYLLQQNRTDDAEIWLRSATLLVEKHVNKRHVESWRLREEFKWVLQTLKGRMEGREEKAGREYVQYLDALLAKVVAMEEEAREQALEEVRDQVASEEVGEADEQEEHEGEGEVLAHITRRKKKRNYRRRREKRKAAKRSAAAAATAAAGGGTPAQSGGGLVQTMSGLSISDKVQKEAPPTAEKEDVEELDVDLDNECAICFMDLEEAGEDNELLSCRHMFHDACVDLWYAKCIEKSIMPTCPTCRATLVRAK